MRTRSGAGAPALLPAETRLADLNIPHWPVLLREMFGLPLGADAFPGAKAPATVGELAGLLAGRTLPEIATRLLEVQRMSEDIEITPATLSALLAQDQAKSLLLLDVREPWEYDIAHIDGSVLMARTDAAALWPLLRAPGRQVVTVCHHGARSLSAALYLKDQGVADVKSLTGGVDAWAREIDAKMRRY